MNIDDLLRIAADRKASDLHLKVGNYPHIRVDGELVPLTDQPRITGEDMLNMAFSMMTQPPEAKVQGMRRDRSGLRRRRSGTLPRQRLPAARQRRHRAARHSHQDSRAGRAASAGGDRTHLRGGARPGAGYRRHRLRQVHHAGRDDRPHQHHRARAHHHHRRPHRVSASRQERLRQPARGGGRYADLCQRAAGQPPPGSGRHPGGRNARPGDHRHRAARGRNRPHGLQYPAHAGRGRDHQPHHQRLSAAGAEADSPAAGRHAQGRHQPAAGQALRRSRTRAGRAKC